VALDKLVTNYDQSVTQFPPEVDAEILACEKQTQRAQDDVTHRIQATEAQAGTRLVQYASRAADLDQAAGLVRRLVNRLRIYAIEYQKRRTRRALRRQIAVLKAESSALQARLDQMRRDRPLLIAQRKSDLDFKIQRLKSVLQSKELAGAQAELAVIDQLARLPASYSVFNDVRLTADHFMRFEGVPLQSAQIDHAVLTPCGVFVIEVKNWSLQFANSADHFNPYSQIGRARFLCQVQLQDHRCQAKVRSIIAFQGTLPPKRDDQYVKVLRLAELNGYITWFKDQPMSRDRLEAIRQFLGQHCAD
jgi:hypothetical protein